MSLEYNIFWVEDLDESFDTYSRRIRKYVESKNFRCNIYRIKMQNEFDIEKINLNDFDILIIDYRLGENEDGREIIKSVRQGKYLNDVLFYSGEGEAKLLQLVQEQALEGVFVSNRDNQVFMPKIEALIDKSIRRTINPINIRGMVMDVTSEFDNVINDIISASWLLLKSDEKDDIEKYIVKNLVEDRRKSVNRFSEKYSEENELAMLELLNEREFTSEKSVRLLNKILQSENHKIMSARDNSISILVNNETDGEIRFYNEYKEGVLDFRNILAHAKFDANTSGTIALGEINGVHYNCDDEFCSMIRKNLLKYQVFFKTLYDEVTKN
jgi:hypothetical protein